MHDVIVAGAGPVGCYTAGLLEKRFDVLVLEKRRTVGGKACSGLISKRLGKIIKVPKDSVEHEINGAIVHSPSGKELRIGRKGLAYVIDRHKFDRAMLERVSSRVMFGREVRKFSSGSTGVKVDCGKTLEAEILVGCDGANSAVRKCMGIRPKEVLTGLVAMKRERDSSDMAEIWLDKDVVRDGFLWKIPRGGRTEYGMLGSKVSFGRVGKFFGIKGYRKEAGAIPLGIISTAFERAILIGDAACQVKPWSGGGVIYGLVAAREAANTIETCFGSQDFSRKALSGYQKAWRSRLEKSIKRGMLLRSLYMRMGNRSLDMMFNRYIERKISGKDMDFPLLDHFEL